MLPCFATPAANVCRMPAFASPRWAWFPTSDAVVNTQNLIPQASTHLVPAGQDFGGKADWSGVFHRSRPHRREGRPFRARRWHRGRGHWQHGLPVSVVPSVPAILVHGLAVSAAALPAAISSSSMMQGGNILQWQGWSCSGNTTANLLSHTLSLQARWLLRRTLWELLKGKFTGKAPRKLGGYFHNDADHRDFTAIGTAAGQPTARSDCLADAVSPAVPAGTRHAC